MMKHLLSVVGIGIAIWLLSLLWLDINRVLMWPLFAGFIAGLTPAYLFGRIFNRRSSSHKSQPIRSPRSVAVPSRSDITAQPTRPSPVMTRRERTSTPTHPMPVV